MEHLTGVLGVLIPLAAIVLGIGVAFWSIYWDLIGRLDCSIRSGNS